MSQLKDYLIMSGDIPCAKWENGELTVLNDKLLPLYLKRVHNAEMWLATRAIDTHRANSRLLKKALRLKEYNDISTVIHVNGATIIDNYWIRPLDSALNYQDIRFGNDYFANLALTGNYDSFNRAASLKNKRTPELTNTGSFEKCWKLIDGKWWMYKAANHDEQFSELFIFALGKALGMNMAVYERGEKCVRTLDFTDSAAVNFEPAFAFMGDNEDYADTVNVLNEICPQAVPDYVKMLFLDTICANPDRHTANFGLLRDTHTGELLSLAPVFDHNMALIARGYPKKAAKNDFLIALFHELTAGFPGFRKYIPSLDENLLEDIMDKLHMKVRTKEIIEIIMSRYQLINRRS